MFTHLKPHNMKRFIKACLLLAIIQMTFIDLTNAQLTSLPNGGNKRATVSEGIGITTPKARTRDKPMSRVLGQV